MGLPSTMNTFVLPFGIIQLPNRDTELRAEPVERGCRGRRDGEETGTWRWVSQCSQLATDPAVHLEVVLVRSIKRCLYL